MPISFDSAFGLHETALKFRGERSSVLANNLANADTPNYKARDLRFDDVLRAQANNMEQSLDVGNAKHLRSPDLKFSADLLYEVPGQPDLDGNTVETHVEQAKFAQNALEYQASFTFLNSKMKGLMTAIRGE